VVHERRHSIVRVDAKKRIGELSALADIAFHEVVIKPALLELNRDFFSVGRRPVVKV